VVVINHDLIAFPGARISLTAINAVVDELDDSQPTGRVCIYYGPYNAALLFEGDVKTVMGIIDDWCAGSLAAR